MPKKKSKQSEAGDKHGVQVQQTKTVPKPGKLGKEIDEIFGGRKKKKKPELENPEKKETTMKKAEMPKRKRKMNELDGSSNKSSRPRKRTEDGLPVFTEDELGINKANAGDTPLCPFDCDCCF